MVVVLGCLTHCLGMAIHRNGHEEMSLFLAADRLPRLLEGLYEEPESTIIQAEVLQAIISHRSDGQPLSIEAGVVRVADALDMAKGRSRIPFESGPRLDPLAVGRGHRGRPHPRRPAARC